MKVTVKNKQSLMDITVENYGQIDNLVEVSNDNGKSISEILQTNEELTVNNKNKGNQEIKDKITTQNLSFNNDFKSGPFNFSLWFLPSKDELEQMYLKLKAEGVGNFTNSTYWSSSENSSASALNRDFDNGNLGSGNKSNLLHVRACRSFTDTIGEYSLRDVGPAGGLIFYIDGTTYYEAAISDQSSSSVWSNINSVLIGITGTSIGTGAQNTLDIINQAGHTTSAAKLCNDLN
jgi:hypothetical protein